MTGWNLSLGQLTWLRKPFRRPPPPARRRQLLVDISIIAQRDAKTGIQRVVRALSEQLRNTPLGNYDLRFVAATRKRRYRHLIDEGDDAFRTGEAIKVGVGDIFLGLDLSSRILPRHGRQIRSWQKKGVIIYVFIYDLLPAYNAEWFGAPQVKAFIHWLRFIGRHADQVLCISQTVAQDFRTWLEQHHIKRSNPIEINVVPLGGDLHISRPTTGITASEAEALNRLVAQDFILTVGTIEPRKGQAIALDAFDWLFAHRHANAPTFVIVGRPGWKTDTLQDRMRNHPQKNLKFFWFDNASDELLTKLYQGCSGVLYPTLAEGFGLPLAEALIHGRPILARDLPVFREAASPLISYFDDDAPGKLAHAIIDWRNALKGKPEGHPQRIFTWKNSCNVLLKHLKIST